ncbi:methyltransferase domain-containing protein [Candidatus Bathyarchaeota archaeon]|nr:MAG: methyltransferase domain-containing protein [Candidatus Bathyarchaeota archaeon]
MQQSWKNDQNQTRSLSVAKLGVNLQILGKTAIPRLAPKLNISPEIPESRFLYDMNMKEFDEVVRNVERVLKVILEKADVSWWDIYLNSDIGMERIALAKEMELDDQDIVLDVGCGRGYFSIAAATESKSVVGIDLMNGSGRANWWSNFYEGMHELNLADRVSGLKSSATLTPFKSSRFTVAAVVHSIRNFQNKETIKAALKEMKRVVVKGGSVILAENIPTPRNKAQEAHLQMFNCKVKYATGELSYPQKEELIEWFQKVGFRGIEIKELNYNLIATPPLFCLDYYLSPLSEIQKHNARAAYDQAISMIHTWGETSPPTLLVKARK